MDREKEGGNSEAGGSEDHAFQRDSPEWAERLSSASETVTTLIFLVGGATLGAFLSGLLETDWNWWLFGPTAAMLLVGTLLSLARNQRSEDLERQHSIQREVELESVNGSYLSLMEEMTQSSFMLSGAFRDHSKIGLAHEMEVVQKAILTTVRHRLGPEKGVRSCLFVVDRDQPDQLVAWKHGEEGRLETPSVRIFREGAKTFDLAFNKLHRFEHDIEELEEAKELQRPLRYRTFAAYPVSTDEKLFGILTIDAPSPGDIGERDILLLGFFASILTATFAGQKNAPAIHRVENRQM